MLPYFKPVTIAYRNGLIKIPTISRSNEDDNKLLIFLVSIYKHRQNHQLNQEQQLNLDAAINIGFKVHVKVVLHFNKYSLWLSHGVHIH